MAKISKLRNSTKMTICIPSYNRGTRLLSYLQKISEELSEDWPILVLDNASTQQTNDYKIIQEMSTTTSGLYYFRQDKNILFEGNFQSMFELVKTAFFMVVSDEDEINFDFAKDLHPQLSNLDEVGAIRPSLGTKNTARKRQATIFEDKIYDPGPEAISEFGLSGNYISGAVYNNKLLKKLNFNSQLQKNMHEHRTYPHLYINILAASSTKTMFMSDIACFENSPEEVASREINYFGAYSFGSRVDQFVALRNAILEAVVYTSESFDAVGFYKCYKNLCFKYLRLIGYINTTMYEAHALEHSILTRSFVLFCLATAKKMPDFDNYSAELEQFLLEKEAHFNSLYKKHADKMAASIQRDVETFGVEKTA